MKTKPFKVVVNKYINDALEELLDRKNLSDEELTAADIRLPEGMVLKEIRGLEYKMKLSFINQQTLLRQPHE